MNALPCLPLSLYHFVYQADNHLDRSQLSPSLWHGVFGLALRERVCQVPELSECKHCMLLQQCDYPFLFEGVKPSDKNITAPANNVPVPHIFKVAAEQPVQAERIKVSMVLVGTANRHLATVIKTMQQLGKQGLGKSRTTLQLQQVIQSSPQLSRLIMPEQEPYHALPPQCPDIPDMPQAVQVIFKTPYRAPSQKSFDSGFFLRQIIRRVSSLQDFYTAQALDADFQQLKQLAQQADVRTALFYQKQQRYSAKHQQLLEAGGLMGQLHINMKGLQALWPYLYLGQWLHVGKQASFGYGCYELFAST